MEPSNSSSRPLMLGTPTRRASPWRRDGDSTTAASVTPSHHPPSAVSSSTHQERKHVSPRRLPRAAPLWELAGQDPPRASSLKKSVSVNAHHPPSALPPQTPDRHTEKMLSEMEERLQGKFFGTVQTLQAEVLTLQTRVDQYEHEARRKENTPALVESAVLDALALYADNGASALARLSEELSDTVTEPHTHQAVCQTLKSSLSSFISGVVTKQIHALWEDPSTALPQSLHRQVSDFLRTAQDSQRALHDEVLSLTETHPLAPRVAAMESQLSRTQHHIAGKPFIETEEYLALKKATEGGIPAIEAFKEEAWGHINETEEMLTNVVSEMRGELQAFASEQQKRNIIENRLEVEEAPNAHLARVERCEAGVAKVKDDFRILKNDLQEQLRQGDTAASRTMNDAVTKTRNDVMEILAALRQDSISKKEFASEKKRLADMVDSISDTIEDSEGRAIDAAIEIVESSKSATATRLTQIEEDIHQIQTAATDIVYVKAAVDALNNDITARIAIVEEGVSRRDGIERTQRKTEQRLKDIDDKLASNDKRFVHTHQLDQREQGLRASLLELEDKVAANTANGTTMKHQRERDLEKLKKNAQSGASSSPAEKAEIDRIRQQVDEITHTILPGKQDSSSALLFETDLKDLKRRFAEKSAQDSVQIGDLLGDVQRLSEEKIDGNYAASLIHPIEGDVKDIKRRFAEKTAQDSAKIQEISAEVGSLQVGKVDVEDYSRVTTALEGEVRDLRKRQVEKGSADSAKIAEVISDLQRIAGTAESLETRVIPLEADLLATRRTAEQKSADLQSMQADLSRVISQQANAEEAFERFLENPPTSDPTELREQLKELSEEMDRKADGMLLDDLTEQVNALPHELDTRIRDLGHTGVSDETSDQISSLHSAISTLGDDLASGLDESRRNYADMKSDLTEITHTHSSMRDELADCHSRIYTLDGYVRELASSRDGGVEELRTRLQQLTETVDDEIKKLRRLVDRAIIALDIQGNSQPGTPIEDLPNTSFPKPFTSKKQVMSAAIRDQLATRPSDRRPSGESYSSK